MISTSVNELVQTLGRQQRVVYALLLREMRNRYGKYYLGYLWAFIMPVFRVAVLTVLHALIFESNTIYGAPPVVFFFLGVWPFLLFLNAYMRSIGSFSSYRSLFVYRTVKPIDAWIAAVVTELAIYLIILILCYLAAVWWGLDFAIDKPLEVIAVVALVYILGATMGLIVETISVNIPDVGRAGRLARRPLFWASGVFFTIDMLPPAIKPYLIWNPVLHATDLIRGMALSEYTPEGSLSYLCYWTLGMTIFALMYYRQHRFDVASR